MVAPFILNPHTCTIYTENCRNDEYDCEDQNCIKKDLECNGFENCRFKSDEHDKCPVSIKMFYECNANELSQF